MRLRQQGFTSMEICVVLIVVIAALMTMWRPLVGAISGRWKQTGDTFGSGLQYEPNRTVIQ